jgi:hypothetical protein
MKSLKDTLTKKRELSLADKEALVEKIHATPLSDNVEEKKDNNKNLHRLTLDLPPWLVEKIKAETERNGQTMRGLILTMLLERFK